MDRKLLRQAIWEKKEYFDTIRKHEDFTHPALSTIRRFCRGATRILDVGVGEGSKLARLGEESLQRVGCDPSLTGVLLARREHPNVKLVVAVGEHLPFRSEVFDRLTCLFVLEHSENPTSLIREVIRVSKKGGIFFFLAPNFGAPNRASPNFHGSRIAKLGLGIINDIVGGRPNLFWNRVEPHLTSVNGFFPDADTTVEPYLRSLVRFLKSLPVDVLVCDSCWQMELPLARRWQKLIRKLGEREVFPFRYWGPHLFLVGKRR